MSCTTPYFSVYFDYDQVAAADSSTVATGLGLGLSTTNSTTSVTTIPLNTKMFNEKMIDTDIVFWVVTLPDSAVPSKVYFSPDEKTKKENYIGDLRSYPGSNEG
jgi:hypothetical protein